MATRCVSGAGYRATCIDIQDHEGAGYACGEGTVFDILSSSGMVLLRAIIGFSNDYPMFRFWWMNLYSTIRAILGVKSTLIFRVLFGCRKFPTFWGTCSMPNKTENCHSKLIMMPTPKNTAHWPAEVGYTSYSPRRSWRIRVMAWNLVRYMVECFKR